MRNDSADQRPIALCPEAFGYGPASKAHSVALAAGIDTCLGICGGVAAEYLRRNGLLVRQADSAEDMISAIHSGEVKPDVAAVFLNPEWAARLSDQLPTFFVDSLAFMWDAALVERLPKLSRCTHIVQDVLGAGDAARTVGLKNVVTVEPIVDLSYVPVSREPIVASLGGQVIHGSTGHIPGYTRLVLKLLADAYGERGVLALTGSGAASVISDTGSNAGLRIYGAPRTEAIGYFRTANVVVSSPGLTTLLEVSALDVPCIPLPPQNYSQCLILDEVANRSPYALHPAWSFLREFFMVPKALIEAEGIALARRRLEAFSESPAAAKYMLLIRDTEPATPLRLATDYGGAAQVANLIRNFR